MSRTQVMAQIVEVVRRKGGLAPHVSSPGPAGPRQRPVDLSFILIRTADLVETGLMALPRTLRRIARDWLARITAGLIWRGVAAVTGIAMAAALVTGLSAEGSAPRLAGTLAPEAMSTVRDVRQQPRLAVAAPVEWLASENAPPRIALSLPDIADLPQRRAWREADGGRSREEAITVGTIAERRGHLLLRIRTGPAAQADAGPLAVHFIRQAAEQGLSVDRTGLSVAVATSWGPLDAAEIVLGDARASRACLAFRSAAGQEAALSGWWCARDGNGLDLAELRCLVDRLEIEGIARSAPSTCANERTAPPKPVRSAANERDRRDRTR